MNEVSLPLSLVRRTARLYGIQTDYNNAWGKLTAVSAEILVRVIEGVSHCRVKSTHDLEKLILQRKKKRTQRRLAPVYIFREGEPQRFRFFKPDSEVSYVVKIETENGENWEEILSVPKGKVHIQGEVKRALPVGYHKLSLFLEGRQLATSHLIVAPLIQSSVPTKEWGIFTPLYGVRSEKNWGVGDLTDLEVLQKYTADRGGHFVGSLPLLASSLEDPKVEFSPYSAMSKLFWNELYLDVAELMAHAGKELSLIQKKKIESLRARDQVAYEEIFLLKKEILKELAYDFFGAGEDNKTQFREFLNRCARVADYAKFRADGDQGEELYHLYVQFQMDQALRRHHRKFTDQEIAGLYLDFPVGVARDGFDQKVFSSSFLNKFAVGAPPDILFPHGQNWGFSPQDPEGIRENGYEYLKESLRHHLRYAKILRLDHVMGFHRLYVIPPGENADHGTYLRYAAEEMFAVLAVEAYRAKARIIGEDLGTVPQMMRDLMRENDCDGMYVFPFEAGHNPQESLRTIRPKALACLNTHDMVPFAGLIQGRDIELFSEIGLITELEKEKSFKERHELIHSWKKSFDEESTEKIFAQVTAQMAKSPAEYCLVNIEDLWGEQNPQNIPGTWKEYPNWQRKLNQTLEELVENPAIRKFLENLAKLRAAVER